MFEKLYGTPRRMDPKFMMDSTVGSYENKIGNFAHSLSFASISGSKGAEGVPALQHGETFFFPRCSQQCGPINYKNIAYFLH